MSVLDGWCRRRMTVRMVGLLTRARVYDDPAYRDHSEGEAMYALLEKEVVPLFYNRSEDGLPRAGSTR